MCCKWTISFLFLFFVLIFSELLMCVNRCDWWSAYEMDKHPMLFDLNVFLPSFDEWWMFSEICFTVMCGAVQICCDDMFLMCCYVDRVCLILFLYFFWVAFFSLHDHCVLGSQETVVWTKSFFVVTLNADFGVFGISSLMSFLNNCF